MDPGPDIVPTPLLTELSGAVEDLAGRFSLEPLLQRILRRAVDLLGGSAGSICTVDEVAGTYRKEADLGVVCRQGSVFPLGEGTTGAVVARRGPVVFDRYADVPGGHLAAGDRSRMHATVAVPIQWGESIIGACVVFTADPAKRWTDRDVGLLQLFAGHAAVALTNARLHADAAARARRIAVAADRERVVREVHDTLVRTLGSALEHVDALDAWLDSPAQRQHLAAIADATRDALIGTRRTVLDDPAIDGVIDGQDIDEAVRRELAWLRATTRMQTDVVVTGRPAAVHPAIRLPALHAVQETLSNVAAHSGATQVRVGLLCAETGLTVLVSDNGRGFDAGTARHGGFDRTVQIVERVGGRVEVESAAGWGTRVRIELPGTPFVPDGNGPGPIRVLVADSRPMVRAGVLRLLADALPDVLVVGESTDPDETARLTATLTPDVVLVGLQESDEAFTIASLVGALAEPPVSVPVLGLCSARLRLDQQAGLARHGCGAVGLDASGPELVRALRTAAAGEMSLAAAALASSSESVAPPAVPGSALSAGLTRREQQVVELVGRGLSDKQLARELGISVKTVEKHVGSALRKTRTSNRTALARGHALR